MYLKKRLTDKGLTLVELLVTLAIVGLISVLIFSNLLSGMMSFKNVNEQVSLHDEANYVMTRIVNNVFEATSVNIDKDEPCTYTVTLSKMNSPNTIIDIKKNASEDYKVYIDEEEILSNLFNVVCTESLKPTINLEGNTVSIKMAIQENGTGRKLDLTNKVSFVKVENGEGAK